MEDKGKRDFGLRTPAGYPFFAGAIVLTKIVGQTVDDYNARISNK